MSLLSGLWRLNSNLSDEFEAGDLHLMFLVTGEYALIKQTPLSDVQGVEVGTFKKTDSLVTIELIYDGIVDPISSGGNQAVIDELNIVDLSTNNLVANFGDYTGVSFAKVPTSGEGNPYQNIWRVDYTTYGDESQIRGDIFVLLKPDGEFFVIDPPFDEFGPYTGYYDGLEYGSWEYSATEEVLNFAFEYNGTFMSPQQDSGLSNRGAITMLRSTPEKFLGQFDSTPAIEMMFSRVGESVVFENNQRSDIVSGRAGIDRIVYLSSRDEFNVVNSSGLITVTRGTEVDRLDDFERITFADSSLAFDLEDPNSAGGIYRTYQAAFNRIPDKGGFGYWIDRADQGASAVQMAEEFVGSIEFQQVYNANYTDKYLSGNDRSAIVAGIYRNVLGRDADQSGLDYYTSVIESQDKTVGRVLAEIADSQENRDKLTSVMQSGMEYDLWLG